MSKSKPAPKPRAISRSGSQPSTGNSSTAPTAQQLADMTEKYNKSLEAMARVEEMMQRQQKQQRVEREEAAAERQRQQQGAERRQQEQATAQQQQPRKKEKGGGKAKWEASDQLALAKVCRHIKLPEAHRNPQDQKQAYVEMTKRLNATYKQDGRGEDKYTLEQVQNKFRSMTSKWKEMRDEDMRVKEDGSVTEVNDEWYIILMKRTRRLGAHHRSRRWRRG